MEMAAARAVDKAIPIKKMGRSMLLCTDWKVEGDLSMDARATPMRKVVHSSVSGNQYRTLRGIFRNVAKAAAPREE
jgi:hypothetical protein